MLEKYLKLIVTQDVQQQQYYKDSHIADKK